MSRFYIQIDEEFDTIVGYPEFVSIEQFAEGFICEMHNYDYCPMTGLITYIYVEDEFENSCSISIDIGYLLAWISDDSENQLHHSIF